jgi:hypothetical protein
VPCLGDGPAALPGTEAIAATAAVRLFVERARDVVPTFALTAGNAAAVAAICRRLDGLPLALELAAARLRVLPPAALLARLDAALPLLAGGARDLPERQRTMGDTIAWSYDLLAPAERAFFRKLAVFAGGWTLEAAEALCEGEAIPRAAMVELLAGLVEQSLVIAAIGPGAGEARYRLLEPVRQYALERLVAHGEEDRARARHATYFCSLAERAGPALFGADQARWLDLLEAEHDNLRATLGWLLARGATADAVRLGWGLHRFWWIRGHLAEGARWLAGVLPRRAELPGPTRALALLTAAFPTYALGDYDTTDTYLLEGMPLAREAGDPVLLALSLGLRGFASLGRGDSAGAREWLDEALALAEAAGHRWGIGMIYNCQGYLALDAGDWDKAELLLERAAEVWDAAGSTWDVAVNRSMRAGIAAWRGNHAAVASLARASLMSLMTLRDRWTIAYGLTMLGGMASERGRAERAARLFGAAAALREVTGATLRFAPDRVLHERHMAAGRAQLDPAAFAAAWAAGRTMPLPEVIAEALAETDQV